MSKWLEVQTNAEISKDGTKFEAGLSEILLISSTIIISAKGYPSNLDLT